MEKYRCKLCLKNFANGKALGGHMRSHLMKLRLPPKAEEKIKENEEVEADSASSSSSSEDEEENQNRKKSIRLVDPKFSFTGSIVLQDRESETESSKNAIRRRSKRVRKHHYHYDQYFKEPESRKTQSGRTELSCVEPEPVSSISDTTTEEDVAYCLMMLSRDKWKIEEEEEEEEEEEDQEQYNSEDSDELIKVIKTRVRTKYKCETCKRVFRSYQALGGHRASHKKLKLNNNGGSTMVVERENGGGDGGSTMVVMEEKIHECPVCYRVFSSGQALGGHKRSHVIGSSRINTPLPSSSSSSKFKSPIKFGESFIDLNLPAPTDDDDGDGDVIQIEEFSAVSEE